MKNPLHIVIFFISVLLLTAVFIAGCDSRQQAGIGTAPPEISGIDITGRSFLLSRCKGTVVVLYFWSDSCCLGNKLSQLERIYRQQKERGFYVVAVNVGNPETFVREYGKNNGLTYTQLTDVHAEIFHKFGVVELPALFILDRKGIVRNKILGDIPTVDLEKLIEKQLTH